MANNVKFDLYWLGLLLAAIAVGWYYTNVNQLIGGVYGFLLVVFAVFKGVDSIKNTTQNIDTLAFLNPTTVWRDIGLAAIIGTILMMFVYNAGAVFFVPPLAIDQLINSAFVTIFMAAFVEESVFRALLQPTLAIYFKKFAIVSILIVAVIFALYHWGAYGANIQNTIPLITVGVIGLMLGVLGSYVFKAALPLIIIHALINAGVLLRSAGVF